MHQNYQSEETGQVGKYKYLKYSNHKRDPRSFPPSSPLLQEKINAPKTRSNGKASLMKA
jgi:hypothetical protein